MPNPPQDSGPTLDRRFKLGKIIGRGPSGVVYAATDLQTNQPCVVKRLHAHFYNRQVLQKVQQDALASAKLGHPSILAPYHVAFEQSGSIYLVTHAVQGESLLTRLQRGPLSLTAALMLFDPLAAALQASHEAGLFHGAITPTNILCVGSARVLLTDFGMCHLRGTPKIKWGGAMGYAAPETFEEGAELCSARGDVFALGALAFECLTGQRMFSSTSLATFLASVATPPRLGSLLPMYDHLDAVLEMACAPEPLDRFANGGALWRALQSSLLDAPESHEEPAPEPPLPPPGPPVPIAPFAPATDDAAAWESAAWDAAPTPSGPLPIAGPPEPIKPPGEIKVNKHPVQALSVIPMPIGESSDAIHPVPLPPPPALSTPVKGPIRVQDPLRTTLPQGIPGKLAANANSEPRKLPEPLPLSSPQLQQAADQSSRLRLPTPRLPQLSPAPLPPMPTPPEQDAIQAPPAPAAKAAAPAAVAAPAPVTGPSSLPIKIPPQIKLPASMTEMPDLSSAPTRPMPVLTKSGPSKVAPPTKPLLPQQKPVAPQAAPPPPLAPASRSGAGPLPAGLTGDASGAIGLPPMQPRPPMPAIAISGDPQKVGRAERSDSDLRPRGRVGDRVLPPLFWATVGGFLVGGMLLFGQILNPARTVVQVQGGVTGSLAPSLSFDEDALIKVTQQHMAQRNYQSALSAAELVLRAHPDNARARRLADQASDLLRSSAVYGGFLRAADLQDADTAAALYAELPADSPFRVNAWEPFMPVRTMFVTRHLNLANAALAAGDCDLVSQQLDELHRIADNERDPDFLHTQRQLTRCRRVFGAATAPVASDLDDEPAAPVPVAKAPEKEPEAPAAKEFDKGGEKRIGLRDPFAHNAAGEKVRKTPRKRLPRPPGETGTSTPAASPPPEKGLPSALRNPFGP